MDTKGLVILKYQDNFADNMTSFAYGKILEKNSKRKCYFENASSYRDKFEFEMSDFNIKCDYISSAKVEKVAKKALYFNSAFIDEKRIKKEIVKKKSNDNKILDLKQFNIDDIPYISDEIKNEFAFKNYDFIVNFDILEDIKTDNSIGLYIDKCDYENNMINFEFINNAMTRLNKYVKQPKLYIFLNKKIESELSFDTDFNYKVINLYNPMEEFYFLKCCKHKIILNTANSYSKGFWAAVLSDKNYGIKIFDKNINAKKKFANWIPV